MKKLFILLFMGVCFTSTVYAGETLTAFQKEPIDKELQQLLNIAENESAEEIWDRIDAIDKIIEKKDTAAIPALIRLNKSKEYIIRVQAAKALGALGDARTIPILQTLQTDVVPWVAEEATRALIKLGVLEETPETIPKAEPVVEKEREIEREIKTDPLKTINNTLLFKIERRDPAIACLLSMATLGGGQIYNYQPHKAIFSFIIGGVSIIAMYSGGQTGVIIGGLALLGLEIWSPFDSYNSAVDINKALEYKYKIEQPLRY